MYYKYFETLANLKVINIVSINFFLRTNYTNYKYNFTYSQFNSKTLKNISFHRYMKTKIPFGDMTSWTGGSNPERE